MFRSTFLAFVFFIPALQYQGYLPVPVPLTIIFSLLFLIAIILGSSQVKYYVTNNLINLFLYLFIWVLLAHFVNSFRFGININEVRLLFGRASFFIIIIATYLVVQDENDYNILFRTLCYSIAFLGVMTILQSLFQINPLCHVTQHPRTYWGISMGLRKTTGLEMSAGEYGIMIISTLPVLVYSMRKKNFVLPRSTAFVFIMIILFASFISQSRNVWLSLLVASFVMIYFYFSESITTLARYTLLLFVCSIVIVFSASYPDLFSSFINGAIGEDVYQANVFHRLEGFALALELFFDNPLLGIGNSNIAYEISLTRGIPVVLHNAYLDQLAGTGLFGFIPYISLFISAIIILLRILQSDDLFCRYNAQILMTTLIGSMTALLFYRGFFPETIAIELGLILSLWRIFSKKVSVPSVSPSLGQVSRRYSTGL